MTRATIVTVLVGTLCLTLSAPPGFAADSCGGGCPKPPSNARAVSVEPAILATYPGNTLSAALAKGKKKTILRADGMLTDDASNGSFVVPREYDLGISVNGLSMHPSTHGAGNADVAEDCGVFRSDPDRECTAVGHWWLDMDDPANAALLGVPITVTLFGGDPSGGPAVGTVVNMSLQVRLEKK